MQVIRPASRFGMLCAVVCLGLASFIIPAKLQAWQKSIIFENIDQAQGLPPSIYLDVVQDHDGFMWFASLNGLMRYDGHRFKVYRNDPERPESIISDTIHSLYVDREGTLWIGTIHGLSRFDRDSDTFANINLGLDDPAIFGSSGVISIIEDHEGVLWLGRFSNGYPSASLIAFDRRNGGFTTYSYDPDDPGGMPGGMVNAIHEDLAGVVWVGTFDYRGDGGLAYFDRESHSFKRVFDCTSSESRCAQPETPDDRTTDFNIGGIYEDRAGTLWINSGNGLITYDRAKNTYASFSCGPVDPGSQSGKVVGANIVEDANGLLWFDDRYRGLTSFDPATGECSHFTHDPADLQSIVRKERNQAKLFLDASGTIWIVEIQGDNISRFDPSSLAFGRYTHETGTKNSLSGDGVVGVVDDGEGILWVAQIHDGLTRIDRSRGIVTPYPISQDTVSMVYFLSPGREGSLWLGTDAGLSRLDKSSGWFEHYLFQAGADKAGVTETTNYRINSAALDSEGDLWMAASTGLIFFEPDSGKFTHYRADPGDPEGFHGDMAFDVKIDSEGAVWVGTDLGLDRLDPFSGVFSHYVHMSGNPDSISQGAVRSIAEDEDGTFWVGTVSGLDHFDPSTGIFRHIGEKTIGNISDIVLDNGGNLWVSMYQNGLLKYDPETGDMRVYTTDDGVDYLVKGILGYSGELLWSSMNGIYIFDPQKLPGYEKKPEVVITDFRLLNKSVPVNSERHRSPLNTSIMTARDISLTHRDYLFSFEFAAPGYKFPKSVRYAYMLDGFDRNWLETGPSENLAAYSHVPPGNYVLRVKAAGRDGQWNGNETTIRLGILPPWWLTWWAYSFYAITFILALFGYIRIRTNKLTRQTILLEKTVAERTAQIREHERHIQHQAEDLEELLHLKEKFITNISHEFRTPLTLMLGPVKHLLNEIGDSHHVAQLHLIRRNSRRLLRLVDQLLGLARLGAEQPLACSPKAVAATVDGIAGSFRPLAEDKGLELVVEESDELWVSCAPDALEKILLNLLSNAIKYTPAGGGVTVATRPGENGMVEISVTDTGIGIPVDEQKAVFERFHRVGDSGENIPGAGIGLALVKELVELHGGHVILSSRVGEGTSVTVSLPSSPPGLPGQHTDRQVDFTEATELEIESLMTPETGLRTEPNQTDEKALILVADDNLDMQNYLVTILSDAYRCVVANDGEQALATAFEHIPDLVLLDIMMPKLDGFQVSHALKEDERTSHIPIVMLTARHDRGSRMESWQEKADAYLTKPFDEDELKLRIANLLEIRDILKSRFNSHFFEDDAAGQVLNEKENGFMKKLEQVLEDHYADPEFGLAEMAGMMHVSARQLQRKLKAVTGHNPAEFLRSYRLRQARDILKTGAQVGLAADAVGFSSPAYFTSCFKAQFGQTPSDYQQRFN